MRTEKCPGKQNMKVMGDVDRSSFYVVMGTDNQIETEQKAKEM